MADCNEVVDALNWLAGYKTVSKEVVSLSAVAASRMHSKVPAVMASLIDTVSSWHLGDAPAGPIPRASFAAMLRGRGYSESLATVGLASYRRDLVSLPDSVLGSPLVTSLARGSARVALEEYQERMLREPGDPKSQEEVGEYTDTVLRHNRAEYRRPVLKLERIGMMDFTMKPVENQAVRREKG